MAHDELPQNFGAVKSLTPKPLSLLRTGDNGVSSTRETGVPAVGLTPKVQILRERNQQRALVKDFSCFC